MTRNKRRLIAVAIVGVVVLFLFGPGRWSSGPPAKIADAFTKEDARAIYRLIDARRRAELWKSITSLSFKKAWNQSLPVLLSRTESISGFPGPPGGASVQCKGLFTDTQSGFMLFNTTNGWRYDSMYFFDAKTLLQMRQAVAHPRP